MRILIKHRNPIDRLQKENFHTTKTRFTLRCFIILKAHNQMIIPSNVVALYTSKNVVGQRLNIILNLSNNEKEISLIVKCTNNDFETAVCNKIYYCVLDL